MKYKIGHVLGKCESGCRRVTGWLAMALGGSRDHFVCSVHCSVGSVQCAVCSVQWDVCSV